MTDNYKDDMKDLKGQETTLEQMLKERHRLFNSGADTRNVTKFPMNLLIGRLRAVAHRWEDAEWYQKYHKTPVHLWAWAVDNRHLVRFLILNNRSKVARKRLRSVLRPSRSCWPGSPNLKITSLASLPTINLKLSTIMIWKARAKLRSLRMMISMYTQVSRSYKCRNRHSETKTNILMI